MCRLCLSRRSLLLAAPAIPLAPARATMGGDAPIEPAMRLGTPPNGRIAVALTLDACPGGFDERLATALVESRIPATIFVTDLWMRRNTAGLAFFLQHSDLFCLQNHGALHIPPILGQGRIYGIPVAGDLGTVQREVMDGAAAISRAAGIAPRWYRGATGKYSPAALPAIRDLGFAIGGFSLNADMGASLPAQTVAERIGRAAHGDVIIGHINQPNRPSGQGLADGVRALQQRGAAFLRLDELGTAGLVAA